MHNYCASVTVNKIGFKIDYTHKLININTEIKLRRTVGTETERNLLLTNYLLFHLTHRLDEVL